MDSCRRIVQVEPLVDDLLHPRRAGLNAEENATASGSGHQSDQRLVDAVRARAAAPGELFLAFQQRFTERLHPFAVDREHVVNQLERADAIRLPDPTHLGNHARRAFQPKTATEKIVGRTKRAGERTPAPELQWNVTAEANVREEMKGGEWQGVEVRDQGGVGIADDLAVLPERDAGKRGERPAGGQSVDQIGKRLLRFTADDEVNPREGAHCGDIDDGCLRAAQDHQRLWMRSFDLGGDPNSQRIAAANRTESTKVE